MEGPRTISRTRQSWRFQRREFVTNINDSNGSLSVTSLALNPGLAGPFPWLSTQAAKWEEYKFHSLQFEYVTRTGSTTVGSVIIAPDYDATDPAPTTEAQITAYEDAVEDVPWKDQICVLRPDSMFPLGPRKFTRSGNVSGDLKTYDVGQLHIGVEGATTAVIGKLWVQYDVELFIPQIESAASSEKTSFFTMNAAQTYATGVPESVAWDNELVNPLGLSLGALGVITLPQGAYLVEYQGTFTDTAAEAFVGIVALLKNGVAASPGFAAVFSRPATAGQSQSVSLLGYVVSSGTDTIEIQANLAGAAGTLTSVADQQQLVIRPA